MSCAWDDKRPEFARVREGLLHGRGDTRQRGVSCRQTVTATVWQVATTGDDENGTGEVRGDTAGLAARGEQFGQTDGLTGLVGQSQDGRVEHARSEEVGLHGRLVAGGKVPGDIFGPEGRDGGDRDEIATGLEVRQESAVGAEAREDQPAGKRGHVARQAV